MLKKCFGILLLTCGLAGGTHAQFMHSLGGTVAVMHTTVGPDGYQNSLTFVYKDITYFPRYNVIENDNSSLSVGIPLGLGFGSASNISDGTSSLYFGFDAPLAIDFNFGAKSTSNSDAGFGGYIGGGFGYRYSSFHISDYYGDASFKSNSYGPLARAGVRFGLGSSSNMGLTIGLYYKIGLETEKYKTYGLNVLMDF